MTDTFMGAQGHLDRLREEILDRGWLARLCDSDGGLILNVRNPAEAALSETIACRDGGFRWPWGQVIGPVSDVIGVADRILHVLRDVAR